MSVTVDDWAQALGVPDLGPRAVAGPCGEGQGTDWLSGPPGRTRGACTPLGSLKTAPPGGAWLERLPGLERVRVREAPGGKGSSQGFAPPKVKRRSKLEQVTSSEAVGSNQEMS